MTRVIFNREPLAREGGSFRKGQIVDLTGPSLKRWLRRGAVEPYTEPPVKQAAAPEVVPEPPVKQAAAPEAVPDPPPAPVKPSRRRTTKPKPKPKTTEG